MNVEIKLLYFGINQNPLLCTQEVEPFPYFNYNAHLIKIEKSCNSTIVTEFREVQQNCIYTRQILIPMLIQCYISKEIKVCKICT